MKFALGVVLIVFGVCAGASAGATNAVQPADKPPAERFGQAVGGALCSLTLVGTGFFLARSGDKKPKKRGEPEA